jgi:DNA polymerase IV
MEQRDRKIIHVDMDCFYAAVEVKHRPELRGKAVAIGGPPDSRSVLCTASYEARKFGVRSAMPSSRAVRLCPQLILLPPDFELYRRESEAVQEIFYRYTDLVEPLSLDEAYLDVSAAGKCKGSATLIAEEIRALIKKELGLTASAGVAPNKFLAKIASDWNKPDGLFVIRPGDVASFVPGLPVEKIHGVGKVTASRMHELGLRTCADLQRQPLERLREWFGVRGDYLAEVARGVDHRPVETQWERKSLTVEETFDKDIASLEQLLERIPYLYREWELRMEKGEYSQKIRGHVVKLKFHDFKTTTHEVSSRAWPSSEDFSGLLRKAWARREEAVRLVGVGVRLGGENGVALPEERPYQLSFGI